jgi:hypothetical protein
MRFILLLFLFLPLQLFAGDGLNLAEVEIECHASEFCSNRKNRFENI